LNLSRAILRTVAPLLGATAIFLAAATASDAATVSLLKTGRELPDGQVTALAVSGGKLYIGSAGQGISAIELGSGKTVRHTASDGLPSDAIVSLAIFQGRLYAGTSAGIALLDGGKWTPVTTAAGLPMRNVVLAASPDGKHLWATSVFLAGGTVRFDGKEWKFMGGEGRGLFNDIVAFGFQEDAVIMGSTQGAVYLRKGNDVESLSAKFPPANVFAVASRGGTVYAGTNLGLFAWRGKEWEQYDLPEPIGNAAVFSTLKVERDILAGTVRGLAWIDGQGNVRSLSALEGFPPGPVRGIVESDGDLFAATDPGVAIVKGWRK
jgi:ligand-binding sensor domain-containing protein